MIKADRVHSTPRTDSSLHQPMFPPRAESVHAFSAQPATGLPESQTLANESPAAVDNVLQFPTPELPPTKSAFAAVKSSGLMVVKKQRRPDNPSSAEDWMKASSRFRAWKRQESMMLTLGEEWHNHGFNTRTAYAMMTVPQKNLSQLHGEMTHSDVDQLLASICRTAEILKTAAQFMDFALIRMVAAGSVAEARGTLRVR